MGCGEAGVSDDCDCEGWIYLPHEEVMKLQRQKNELYSRMLDALELAPKAPFLPTPKEPQ